MRLDNLTNKIFVGTVIEHVCKVSEDSPDDFPPVTCDETPTPSPCAGGGSSSHYEIGDRRVWYKGLLDEPGIATYRVHIPELMPNLNICDGVLCGNAIIRVNVQKCDSMGGLDALGDLLGDLFKDQLAKLNVAGNAANAGCNAAWSSIGWAPPPVSGAQVAAAICAAFNSAMPVLVNGIGNAFSEALDDLFGRSNEMITYLEFIELPINTKVLVSFLENDINSGMITNMLPFIPCQYRRHFRGP